MRNMFRLVSAAAFGAMHDHAGVFASVFGGGGPKRALSIMTPTTSTYRAGHGAIKAGSKKGTARSRRLALKRRNVSRDRRAHR